MWLFVAEVSTYDDGKIWYKKGLPLHEIIKSKNIILKNYETTTY